MGCHVLRSALCVYVAQKGCEAYIVDNLTNRVNQTPRSVVPDLGLHCVSISHKKDARLITVFWIIWQTGEIRRCVRRCVPMSHTEDARIV